MDSWKVSEGISNVPNCCELCAHDFIGFYVLPSNTVRLFCLCFDMVIMNHFSLIVRIEGLLFVAREDVLMRPPVDSDQLTYKQAEKD